MPKLKITIGVIFGGRSGEHEVSLVSAQSVMAALDRKKYTVIPIGITKSGHWLAGADALRYLKTGLGRQVKREGLIPEGNQKIIVPSTNNTAVVNRPLAGKIQKKLDVVFPVLHGSYGEDGTIQGLFELADLPYVGAGVLASACGMDKAVMKSLFAQAGLPQPRYFSFLKHEWLKNKNKIVRDIESRIGFPCFVKPANLGSSVGISKCKSKRDLIRGIKQALSYDRKCLVEEGISGREFECAVLGHNHPVASLPGEIRPNREFYDYQAKYVDGQSELIAPAPISKKQTKLVQTLAIKAFKAIDCSGMARVDFFLEQKSSRLLVNEINTIPGFTSISMYPRLWQISGLSYPKLIDKLIQLALEKHREKNALKTSYQPIKKWYL